MGNGLESLEDRRSELPPEAVYALDIIEFAKDDAPPKRIWIASVGTYHHPTKGKFTLSPERMEQIVSNFNRDVSRGRTSPVPIDIDHATLRSGENEDRAARGWIKALSFDGTTLWGEVDWTEKGGKMVAAKEFRFTSPVLLFSSKDAATGENIGAVLHSVALTNQPILPNGVPLVASQSVIDAAPIEGMHVFRLQDANESGPAVITFPGGTSGQSTNTEDVQMAVEKITLSIGDSDVEVETTAASKDQLLALAQERDEARAKADEAEKAKSAAEAKVPPPGTVTLSHDDWTKVQAQAQQGEQALARLHAVEASSRLERAVQEGRITAAEAKQDHFVAASKDADRWALVLSCRAPDSAWPASAPSGTSGQANTPAVGDDSDPRDNLAQAVMAMSHEKGVSWGEAVDLILADPDKRHLVAGASVVPIQ